MKILVTGACGYKGSVLVPKLLMAGHTVIAFDIMWFGNFLTPHPNLEIIEGDVRDISSIPLKDVYAIIHLSSVANDPCSELDPVLTWEISCLATMQLAHKAAQAGVRQFIYASSGSVYGVKNELNVTEDLDPIPLSEYNKTKMVSERVLLSYSDKMSIQIVRPATVCGVSPRMRFDVAVNLLTIQALTKGEITVFGGTQTRPNVHIDDITDLYLFFLARPEIRGVFNAGFENMSLHEIALLVSQIIKAKIKIEPSNDPRSYRLCSNKLLFFGFKPKKTVKDAVEEISTAFSNKTLIDSDRNHNLKWMLKNACFKKRSIS